MKYVVFTAMAVLFASPVLAADEEYKLGPDSMRHEGVPKGTVTKSEWHSKFFPGTVRDYYVYVPAQYDGKAPACVMVFQDGHAYVKEDGEFRAPVVFDNLINKGELPVTIGIFIDPGHLGSESPGNRWQSSNRSFEYDSLSDQYARFLLDEILPEVGKKYKLTDDPERRAICGISSGGICAFTVAWQRPDAFRKVLSHVGSFTNIRGGHVYPSLIRSSPVKPLRVFLQDGSNDLDNQFGNWWLANQEMAAALKFRGYDYKFVGGTGQHGGKHGGAILPDSLRWLWRSADASNVAWKIGAPIVTYWAGPPLSDAVARQMAEGGWNLVWCRENELDVAQRHGLRAQLQDALLAPASLNDAKSRAKLDALIARVRKHPALYSYFIVDEPNAADFPSLGKIVAYLRERDPAHLAYINLFPTYADNSQLGTKGDTVTAYREYLRKYVEVVKPSLISYDHYQFAAQGDNADYFLNLKMIRRAALEAHVPLLNIVQAATWTSAMRAPGPDELRYLIYTTLAYGGQGMSYYVYCAAGHTGGIALADGTPTRLYHALRSLNREFVAVAKELQPLRSLGVYHAGMSPPGSEPLPSDAPFRFEPAIARSNYNPPERVRGLLVGYFGNDDKPTHAVVVNLDYKTEATAVLVGPGSLEGFDASSGAWSATGKVRLDLRLPPGGGKLVRVSEHAE